MIKLLHRGDTNKNIENTLEAIDFSFKNKNFQGFETDLKLTKDDKWIIFHDSNLKRLCDLDKELTELNYNDLPLIKNKYKIPKLIDLYKFNNYEKKVINLEIKEDFNINNKIKNDLLKIIKKIKHTIVISSFNWEWYNFFKKENITFGHLVLDKFPEEGSLWIVDYKLINHELINKCNKNNIKLGCYTLNKSINFKFNIDIEIWDN